MQGRWIVLVLGVASVLLHLASPTRAASLMCATGGADASRVSISMEEWDLPTDGNYIVGKI